MCSTCGCSSNENGITLTKMGENHHTHHHPDGHTHSHEHHHSEDAHTHEHHHEHHHEHDHHHHEHHHHSHDVNIVELEKDILHQNQLGAERNRGFFEALNIFVKINLQFWLDKPFEQPPETPKNYYQGVLFEIKCKAKCKIGI